MLDYKAAKQHILDLLTEMDEKYNALTSPVSSRYHGTAFAFAELPQVHTQNSHARSQIDRIPSKDLWDRARANTMAGDGS